MGRSLHTVERRQHIITVLSDQEDVIRVGQIRHPNIPTNHNSSVVPKGFVEEVVDG